MASLLWRRYLRALQTAPLLTKALTAAALAAAADALAQSITSSSSSSRGDSKPRQQAPSDQTDGGECSRRFTGSSKSSAEPVVQIYNLDRIGKMALFGLLWSGPIGHFWYSKLQKSTGHKEPLSRTIQRVLIDQLSYGPLNNAAVMAYIACVVNRLPLSQLPKLMKRNFASVQLKGWRVWPAAMFLNYRFIPQDLRLLFANLVALLWSTFLIWNSTGKDKLP